MHLVGNCLHGCSAAPTITQDDTDIVLTNHMFTLLIKYNKICQITLKKTITRNSGTAACMSHVHYAVGRSTLMQEIWRLDT